MGDTLSFAVSYHPEAENAKAWALPGVRNSGAASDSNKGLTAAKCVNTHFPPPTCPH